MQRPAEVVVITGASAGVGRATAVAFARRGAHIGLVARGRERLEQTRHGVEEAGGRAVIAVADVADADQVEAAAVETEKAFGPIDIWVNNAMTSVFAPVTQVTPDEFRRVMEVTFLGYVHGTQAALRRMLPRNAGTIVQVGSALAYRGIPLQAPYCAAKHAIQGFCDSLWSELIHQRSGVRMTMETARGSERSSSATKSLTTSRSRIQTLWSSSWITVCRRIASLTSHAPQAASSHRS